MTEAETSKQRSAARSAVLDVLAGAPPEGLAVAAIMALANVVSRDAADHLLYRMVRDGEVERRGRGRYVRASTAMPDRMQPQTAPARTPVERPSYAVSETALPVPKRASEAPVPIQSSRTEVEKLLQAVGKREESRLGPKPGLAAVRTADPLDLGTFCARVGCAYVKHGLCPPFALREAAAAWAADGVALSHCLSAIEEHLRDHAASCRSGSGDRLFGWLDKIIRHSWNKSHPASRLPPARTN
jgi:hypothetical protein